MAGIGSSARHLAVAATLVPCIALPLALTVANRSTPVILGITVLLSVAAVALMSGSSAVRQTFRNALTSPAGLVAIAIVAAGLLTGPLTHSPAASLHMLGQFAIATLLSAVLLQVWPQVAGPRWPWMALVGMLAAMAIIAADMQTGFLLKRSIGARSDDYVHNRPLVTLVLLFWPVSAALTARGHGRIAVILAALLAVLVMRSVSQSALLGLLAGLAAWLLMREVPRLAIALAVVACLITLAAAPWTGAILSSVIDERLGQLLASAHVTERLGIWSAYGEAARTAPLTGWGFNASAGLGKVAALADIRARTGDILMDSHPHHAFLQIWLEFGVIGALVAGGLVLALLRVIWRLDPAARPYAFALAAACLAIGLVSHGLWQAWWWAGIGIAVTLLAARPRPQS